MELQCSLECSGRPAFVYNYCLIKHAGQLPGSDWLATDTQHYTECLQLLTQAFALLSGPLQKQLLLKPPQLLQYVIIQYRPLMGWSTTPCFNWDQVRSLSPHKDNTIILKCLWSLVIEFSKGTKVFTRQRRTVIKVWGIEGGGERKRVLNW